MLSQIIGHRGVPSLMVENSLRSFQCAYGLGCQSVEFDVKLTKDKVPVVFHDEEMERLLGCKGLIEDILFHDLKELLQTSSKPWMCQEPILTLEALFSFFLKTKRNFNLELKPNSKDQKETAWVISDMFEKFKDLKSKALVSSFDFSCLRFFKEKEPDMFLGMLFEGLPETWESQVDDFKPYSVHIDHPSMTSEFVKKIKEKKLKLFVYTVNDVSLAQRLFEEGVDGIFTDQCQLFLDRM